MSTETVHAEWVRDEVFLLKDHFDFPLVMTQPQGVNGADLLPLSLIGCAGWDVIAILKKQHQQVTGLEVSAESQRDEAPPWRFRRILIHYRLRGRNLVTERVKRAIDLAETKYCSVYATLRDAVEIQSEFEIVNE
jgi:putative redox protein